MNRENSRDERAAPQPRRQLQKQNKKKERVRTVDQHIHEMVSARFRAEESPVQHVRHRRQWMPVVRMNVRERPDRAVPIQSGLNLRISTDVIGIVVIEEAVAERLPEDRERYRDQRDADRQFQNEAGTHHRQL